MAKFENINGIGLACGDLSDWPNTSRISLQKIRRKIYHE